MTCVPHVMRPEPQTQDTLLTTLCSAYSHDQTMVSLKINLDFHQEWNKNWNWLLFFVSLDTFYGGESISSDTPQSFSCPYCGKLGYTETALYDHVTTDHTDTPYEVVTTWTKTFILKWKLLFCLYIFLKLLLILFRSVQFVLLYLEESLIKSQKTLLLILQWNIVVIIHVHQ